MAMVYCLCFCILSLSLSLSLSLLSRLASTVRIFQRSGHKERAHMTTDTDNNYHHLAIVLCSSIIFVHCFVLSNTMLGFPPM